MQEKTLELPASVLVKKQQKHFGPKVYTEGKDTYKIIAHVRYDDECGNGHNTFSITADIWRKSEFGKDWREDSGGCCHDEVAKHFPELAPLIKWHLVSSDGPMHYVSNTLYHAGNRDHNGLLKGEFRQFKSHGKQNGGVEGVPNWELKFPEGISRDIYATEKPNPIVLEWQPYGRTGEGKERQLDFARSSAVWPEATDEQLCAEPEELKAALEARLPALIAEFKQAVESLGFTY